MLVLAIRYRAIEVLAMGFLLDMLWLPHDSLLFSLPIGTIVAIVIVWGLEPLRLEFLR